MTKVLAIEQTTIEEDHVTVEAIVDQMRCIYRGSYSHPAEYAPALCTASFFIGDESIPVDEDGFCSYLDSRDLDWQPVDTSDLD